MTSGDGLADTIIAGLAINPPIANSPAAAETVGSPARPDAADDEAVSHEGEVADGDATVAAAADGDNGDEVADGAADGDAAASEGAAVAELSVTNKIKPVDKPLYGEMSAGDIEQLFGEYLTLPHRPARHSYQRRQRATRGVGGIPLTLLLSVLSLARPPTRSPARSTPAF